MNEKMTAKGWRLSKARGKMLLETKFVGQTRMPRRVKISNTLLEDGDEAYQATLEGNPGEVFGILNALAEVAWANGWRPEGLAGRLLQTLQEFKARRCPSDEN